MYRKKRKSINIKNIIIIVSLVVLFTVGIIVNIYKTDRKLTIFESAIKDGMNAIVKVVNYPFSAINKKINKNREKEDLYNKYQSLLNEEQNSILLKSENEQLKIEIKNLKQLLELNNVLSEYDNINATVIGRDLNIWNETIVIDKGEKDNINIVNEGLIGKIIKTTTFSSTVRLLTANNSNDKISIKIVTDDNIVYGILNGYNKDKKTYKIEGVFQKDTILNQTIVTTTGMGDVFPSGIVVGEIVGVSTDEFDLAQILEMKSLVDFNNINYVKVLKRGTK